MTSSDQLSCLEPWLYRPTTFADTWLSDTQTLTLALQKSLSSPNQPSLSPLSPLLGSGSDIDPVAPAAPEAAPTRRSNIPATVKPTKRRSRASKKSTTTFITANPANFRQMVQQVTGVRFSGGFPVKPEPQRAVPEFLPTLDTSSFVLSQMCPEIATSSAMAAGSDGGGGGGGGFDFEAFSCFPTLESWKVM